MISEQSVTKKLDQYRTCDIGIGNHAGQFVYENHVCTNYGNSIWKNDRNLSLHLGCTNSIFHDVKSGMGTDWKQLFPWVVCPWISGIFYDGVCWHLCGAGIYH